MILDNFHDWRLRHFMQKYVSKANVISKYFLFNYLELACKIDITFALDQNFRVRSVDL